MHLIDVLCILSINNFFYIFINSIFGKRFKFYNKLIAFLKNNK
jgi:hypothetical protein